MNFSHPLLWRLSGLLAALGGLTSVLASLLAGASFSTILYRLMIYLILMATLGVLIFFVLQFFAPEILEFIETFKNSSAEQELGEEPPLEEGFTESETSPETFPEEVATPHSSGEELNPQKQAELSRMKKNIKPGEGEIVVEGFRLPNNPELMAEAIRDTLAKDNQ